MHNSTPSHAVLKQYWTTTQERPAITQRPWHDQFCGLLGLCTYLMPVIALIAILLRS